MTETVTTETPTVSAPVELPALTATFTIKVSGIRTATIDGHAGAIKQVDWIMIGTESGQTFDLPQTTTLNDPDGQPFIELANVTEAEIIGWIESTDTRIPSIKQHIQYVLTKEIVAKSLTSTQLPWLPPVTTPLVPTLPLTV
jgi:hypothetical protein